MASYTELYTILSDRTLKNKVLIAVIVAADTVRGEDAGTTNHADRLIWANAAFSAPHVEAEKAMMALLAANNTATLSNIISATDAAIQANVDSVIDVLSA